MSLATCAIALLATLIAAITDTRSGRIPNWLTTPLFVLGPLLGFVAGGAQELILSLLAILLCGLVPLLLFARAAMGGGDVKLLAGLGGLLGTHIGIELQFFSFCVVAFVLLAHMAWDGRLFVTMKNVLFAGGHLFLPKRYHREIEPALLTQVRMGLSIFVATLVSIVIRTPYAPWLQ
jgi:prepilin peptidase CpaA